MKEFDLVGLGNALVDLQFKVNDEDLIDLNLKKGEMTLVPWEEQNKILEKFSSQSMNKCSGGSAANTIIAFSQLGGKSAYKTVLGNDEFGNFYSNEFKELGIELSAEQVNTLPTGLCVVLITPDGERTMHTSLAATGLFESKHINEEIIKKSEWLYLEGYKFSEEDSTKAIYKALDIAIANNTKIAVTFSDFFITNFFRENLRKVVENSDLIFCNENEAKSFTELEDTHEAFTKLCSNCRNVVMTMGGQGSLIKWENEVYQIPAYPVNLLDTTGAGDIFAAGFLYGIIYHKSPLIAGYLGSYLAAKVVSQLGARLNEDLKIADKYILSQF